VKVRKRGVSGALQLELYLLFTKTPLRDFQRPRCATPLLQPLLTRHEDHVLFITPSPLDPGPVRPGLAYGLLADPLRVRKRIAAFSRIRPMRATGAL
jgi:hypothetical protein